MTETASRRLGEPVTDDGIRWLNAFNGRILSAEDLRVDQTAIARARQQLGRAVGAGVVAGLAVDIDPSGSDVRPVLGVDPGLALNLAGQPLELGRRVTIGIVRPDRGDLPDDADFAPCDVVLSATTGLGAYVLTIGPALTDAGKAPVAGLGNEPAACNTAYTVEGVRFQLFPVDTAAEDFESRHLRNCLAYRMYGEPDPRSTLDRVEPYAARERARNGLDDLQAACLGDTDVALALLVWRPGSGVAFVDPWSVRRRPAPPTPGTSFVGAHRDAAIAEGEARYLQLLDQLRDELAASDAPSRVRATDLFRYLPPAGVIPIASSVSRGFDVRTFFEGLKVHNRDPRPERDRRPAFIESALVPDLLRESLAFPPIELDTDPKRSRVIWLYLIRENARTRRRRRFPGVPGRGFPEFPEGMALDAGASIRLADRGRFVPGGPLPYGTAVEEPTCVLYTTGDMPYRADARFDLGYWDYANFAEID